MTRRAIVISLLSGICWLLYGFSGSGDGSVITGDDVRLQLPAVFPEPVYAFGQNRLTQARFALGRRLFYDPILSTDSTISCGSCHKQAAAFANTGEPLSHGIYGLAGKRNVPALQNLLWKDAYMWDGAVNHLEVQPLSPITNPVEMGASLASVLSKLQQSAAYRAAFADAWGDTLITSARMLMSLAQFTGSMISASSRYDHYIAGTAAFSAREKKGLVLFQAKCAACHSAPLFTSNAYISNGLTPDVAANDKGRGVITGIDSDNYAFRVPGLRNVQNTFPYMHDGRFATLHDVLDYYGTPASFGPAAAPALKKIGLLTQQERNSIVSFLLTLTDTAFLADPRFADPLVRTK